MKNLLGKLAPVLIVIIPLGLAGYMWHGDSGVTHENIINKQESYEKVVHIKENGLDKPAGARNDRRHGRWRLFDGMIDRYRQDPDVGWFITVDFVLNSYGAFLGYLQKELEVQEFKPLIKKLSTGLHSALENEYDLGKGSDMALAYSVVLCSLAGVERFSSASVASAVREEIKLIEQHAGVDISPVTGGKIDYSQFTPRGYYTETEELKSYFRTMMYAGLVDFHLKESAATGVTKEMADEQTAAAVRISRAISGNKELDKIYRALEEKLQFFVGSSDDLGVGDYSGFDPDGTSSVRQAILSTAIKNGRLPRINGYYETVNVKTGESPAVLTAGFRLIGQRYSPESEAFQMVVYPNVKEYTGANNPFTMTEVLAGGIGVRGYPTLLDIPAGLGSKKADNMIKSRGDADYSGYKEAIQKVSVVLKSSAESPSSLADMNLHLAGLLVKRDTPEALNASIGFWSRQRHNVLLYMKQAIFSLGIPHNQPMAYIEDMPEVYAYIVNCLAKVEAEVDDADIKAIVDEFRSSMEKILEITVRQEAGKATLEDRAYLNHIGKLWMGIMGCDGPVVCDVFTENNNRMVLEAGLGKPVQVTKEIDGVSLTGYRMSVYEFKQPMDNRLTDEDWCNMLNEGKAKGRLVFQ